MKLGRENIMEDHFEYDISFIVPVYNTEKFLVQCLESIIQQEGVSKEIIVIDDGSSDRSLDILKEYQEKYRYMHLLLQEHKGASSARNAGIECARGRWIYFVDSDDYLEKHSIAKILKDIPPELDIIFTDYAEICANKRIKRICASSDSALFRKDFELFQRAVLNKNYNQNKLQIVTPWAKLYRTDFLKKRNIRFTPGVRKSQDLLFNFEVYQWAERGKYFASLTYYYRYNPESLCNRYTSGVLKDFLCQSKKIKKLLIEYNKFEKLEQDYYFRCTVNYMFALRLDYAHPDNKKKLVIKKKDFEKSLQIRDVKEAIECVDEKNFSSIEKILLRNVKKKKFYIICLLNAVYTVFEKMR